MWFGSCLVVSSRQFSAGGQGQDQTDISFSELGVSTYCNEKHRPTRRVRELAAHAVVGELVSFYGGGLRMPSG